MKFNNTFEWDLELGQLAEKRLAEILQNAKIEVKRDMMAHKTGQVFVEYLSRGKPSGISKTTADFWAFVLNGQRIILIPTDSLKDICRAAIREGKTRQGGDENSSVGAMVRLEELVRV